MVKDGTSPGTNRGRGAHPAGHQSADVEVVDGERRLAPAVLAWLTDHARRAVGELAASGEIRVRILGDEAMAIAHQRYAGVAGTTDVLTFDLTDRPSPSAPPSPPLLDTDILVCADEAARQAATRGHPIEREFLLYIVHGLLHCLGHDDHDEVAATAMHAREDEVLAAIGVGPTYGPTREGAKP